MKYWKPITLAIFGMVLGYFLTKTLFVLTARPLPWPYNATAGYIFGLSSGLFIAFKLIGPWKASLQTKVITAVIILGFVASVGISLENLGIQMTRHTLILNELQSR